MSRNIIVVLAITMIILAGVFFIFKGEEMLNTALFEKDEAELTALENDIAAFNQDETILDEVGQTFSDILDESAVVGAESALESASVEKEASEADFSGDLNVFDEGAMQELDQIFGEISQ